MPNVDHHPCLRGAEELAAAKKSKAIYLYKVGSPQNESVLSEMAKKSLLGAHIWLTLITLYHFFCPVPRALQTLMMIAHSPSLNNNTILLSVLLEIFIGNFPCHRCE